MEALASSVILGVRHAEVENPANVIYARLPGFRLSDGGRSATERLAERLRAAPLVAVYASPLERAEETADILARAHDLAVRTDERLIEWSFWTRWQGTPWLEVRDQAPGVFRAYAEAPESLCPEDPLRDVASRVLAWAAEARERHPDGLVVGVSHEAPLVSAYLRGAGLEMSAFPNTQVGHLRSVRFLPGSAAIVDTAEAAEKA